MLVAGPAEEGDSLADVLRDHVPESYSFRAAQVGRRPEARPYLPRGLFERKIEGRRNKGIKATGVYIHGCMYIQWTAWEFYQHFQCYQQIHFCLFIFLYSTGFGLDQSQPNHIRVEAALDYIWLKLL